jgi:endonuclease YncB( thermonuclease family)
MWYAVILVAAGLFILPNAPLAADLRGAARVVDGDTLDLAGTRVRLFGIDAPERDQTCLDADQHEWACGQWVTAQLAALTQGQDLRCRPLSTDRYGRTVARCFLRDQDLGQKLVQAGLAFAYRQYSLDYDLDEKSAAIAGRGLHSSTVQSPSAYRRAKAQVRAKGQATGQPAGCSIKGNISARGVRIFHQPGQRDYAATRIQTHKGERWFCTAAEARAAGWRAARR